MRYDDKDESLERSGTKKPDLEKIIDELQQAHVDSSNYSMRIANARGWWQCEWDGMSSDGRRWWTPSEIAAGKPSPWNGCSDSRLRIVSTIVQEHVTLCLAAFWSAKKQATSIRPFISGRQTNVMQHMLDWRIGVQMKRELMSELNMALGWRFAYGLCFLKIEWEQKRELTYVPITLDMIGELSAALGLGDVMDKILDPDGAFDKDLVTVMQAMSPVLPTHEARTVLKELRDTGASELPVASLRVNKPKWSAKRPFIDITIPSETCDIQVSRFTGERELVSEVELVDRIETDGYDPDFVDEALRHKGKFCDWMPQPYQNQDNQGSNRDLVDLTHCLSWRLHNGAPCLYRTVFNHMVAADKLYAVHRKFEYEHGQFPFVALRRNYTFRPLLSSIGIAEEAYTDERDIKIQQDGLNDHTDIVRQPPKILPTLRAQAMASQWGPNATMTAMRPESVVFPELPPWDQTPLLAMQMVTERLNRRYPIQAGPNVDPSIVALFRQQLVNETNGEFDLALDQTVQLMQQFETDEDIARVAGGEPWNFSRKDIQGQYEISSAVDINNVDIDRAKAKMELIAQMLPFKQAGGVVFKAAANIVDPDMADALEADEMGPVAQERETNDEYNAIAQIMAGIEPRQNVMANPQFRLQIIQQIAMDPGFMQKLSKDEVAQKRLQKRIEQYNDQIQQFQKNPQIGRQVATQTFANKAPALQAAPAA